MTRANILLSALLVACALGLVTSQYRARKLFVDTERAQAQAARLEVGWNQLQVEQTALAKASLIDTKARRELAMQPVSAERTLHLVVDPVDRTVRLGTPLPEVAAAAVEPAARARTAGAPR
ncbi:MAG: cell division protein FtsL [Lautropia sp.]|nr:MAG: cell division protein FtsL [Pseudomonadota bacterium]MBC6959065.1 cell division protein FtsL [Lautropia sp.]MCL4702818.1 cell division protein FtsL [Burkholderiaceae bacterium]MDL1906327.1 cell division protein FtsL [Betaproteobacteria bacterium PRO1]RIK90240.1 MAG: cell division protein FtsL [Burkholderiales bacterium]